MKTTKENIDRMLGAVKFIFENYSAHMPVLTGSLAMYLNGLDYGVVNDIDIMFLNRKNMVNKKALKAELDKLYPDLDFCLFTDTIYSGDVLDTSIGGVIVKYVDHASLYNFLKSIFEFSHEKEKRLEQFRMYEEWIENKSL